MTIDPELRERIRAHAKKLAAEAPPFTEEQRAHILRALGPAARRVAAREAEAAERAATTTRTPA